MRRFASSLLVAVMLWSFAGCKEEESAESTASKDQGLQIQPTIGDDSDFVDLNLQLESLTKSPEGIQQVVATGTEDGQKVGFCFMLPAEWKQGYLGDEGEAGRLVTYQARITLERTGTESDAFVLTLAKRYGLQIGSSTMAVSIPCTAISLQGDPRNPEAGPVKMKLFFADEDEAQLEERYAEHFLNFDVAAKTVEFREKDPEYRKPLLRALTTPDP